MLFSLCLVLPYSKGYEVSEIESRGRINKTKCIWFGKPTTTYTCIEDVVLDGIIGEIDYSLVDVNVPKTKRTFKRHIRSRTEGLRGDSIALYVKDRPQIMKVFGISVTVFLRIIVCQEEGNGLPNGVQNTFIMADVHSG